MVSLVCQVNLLYLIFDGLFSFWLQCIYMCIFSHTFYCCYRPLPLHWAFAILWSFPFFPLFSFFFLFFSCLFFIILIFKFFKHSIFFLYLFLCLPFLLFFSPCSWTLMYINLLHLPLFKFAYLFFLFFFPFFPFLSTYLLVLFSLLYFLLGTLL